jgi:sugar/nucleoside kinase (ribokinase family)
VVVGDVMADVVVDAGTLVPGGDVAGRVRIRPGGAGANAAVWAASTGARVRLHGRIGDDMMGTVLSRALLERGVEASLRTDHEALTGSILVVVEGGERSMVADRGANARLSPEDLPERLEAGAVLVSGYVLFDSGSEPAGRAALERASAPFVAVDAASWPLLEAYGRQRFFERTEPANVLLANEREAEVLWADRRLTDHYANVIVKRRGGAMAQTRDEEVFMAGTSLAESVDPTGAGDAFDGVLLGLLAGGAPLAEALEAACHAGRRCALSAEAWPETR